MNKNNLNKQNKSKINTHSSKTNSLYQHTKATTIKNKLTAPQTENIKFIAPRIVFFYRG